MPIALLAQEQIGYLDQDTGSVAGKRVSADGAAMTKITQYPQPTADNVMAFAILNVRKKTNTAGIMFVSWVVKPLLRRQSTI
jgi:hypothetical protein